MNIIAKYWHKRINAGVKKLNMDVDVIQIYLSRQ
jgi:hypothetical protein